MLPGVLPDHGGAPLALWISGRGGGDAADRGDHHGDVLPLLRHVSPLPRRRTTARVSPADNAATRTLIAQLTAGLLEPRRGLGNGAFPSSHVARLGGRYRGRAPRKWRAVGLVLAVPTTLLALGSVYGQFHYAVDALAGLGLGLAVALGARLTPQRSCGWR